MAKRGSSNLSLVIGVDKPAGLTSHDVVNRCRRIFGERRVGHTGTLDPFASGVLPICVGPATRLDAYLTGHDKRYLARIDFGASTTTDDCEGELLYTAAVPSKVLDEQFAQNFLNEMVGKQKQLPPVYSAIKVNGQKSYEAARKGHLISLEPREIEIYEAQLVDVGTFESMETKKTNFPLAVQAYWDVAFSVSKGTYIRSLARDIGKRVGTYAHLGALRRTSCGHVNLSDCVTLEALELLTTKAALDPIQLLGLRFSFLSDAQAGAVHNGNQLSAHQLTLYERRSVSAAQEMSSCTSGVYESNKPPYDGEVVALIANNKVVALYEFSAERKAFRSRCGFSIGVSRGEA